jgi:hypothetical protein
MMIGNRAFITVVDTFCHNNWTKRAVAKGLKALDEMYHGFVWPMKIGKAILLRNIFRTHITGHKDQIAHETTPRRRWALVITSQVLEILLYILLYVTLCMQPRCKKNLWSIWKYQNTLPKLVELAETHWDLQAFQEYVCKVYTSFTRLNWGI